MYSHDTGALYVVATPIGNLKDITLRALEVLKGVRFVAAEDTRVTRALLDHYGIETPCVSYNEHNRIEKTPVFLHRLEKGESIALVSDAGTPLVSDPGSFLVEEALDLGFPVHPVPGASSLLAALSVSGLFRDSFFFGGFLPRKRGELTTMMEELLRRPETHIFFESPNRIEKSLDVMQEILGEKRRVAILRELTKRHETLCRGTIKEALACLGRSPLKGEIVLVVEGAEEESPLPQDLPPRVWQALGELDLPPSEKARFLTRAFGLERKVAYRLLEGRSAEED
ncbi:MAG: 16S rRNA (cytidine(1402)-2'-O)-methyltransferase [Leptospirales bacterium]